MAYGRIYIDNLRKKVNVIFDDLLSENKLSKENFIEAFEKYYPKDYALLQYEYDFKLNEFKKKNRRGQPKLQPIKPVDILKNMYENYYFKIVIYPKIKYKKREQLNIIRVKAGQMGYKIQQPNKNKSSYTVIKKDTKEIVAENIDLGKLKEMFPVKIKKKYR